MRIPETPSILDLGRKNTAAHTGAVDEDTTNMGYAKHIVTDTEAIKVMLGGSALQMRTAQSISAAVEEGALQQFSISIMDVDSGAVAAASIDITSISAVIEKSTGGGAFSSAGLDAIVFGKEDGRVFKDYTFNAAQWQVGDVYKIVVSGIEATIGGDTAYVPAMVWSNFIVEDADLKAAVDAINTDLGDFSAQTNLQSLLAALGIPDTSGKPLYTCLITDRLDHATHGLSALQVHIGDFTGKTYDKSLLETLGVPDTDGKDLYTCLVTDRLDHATYGLSKLFLAAVGGTLADAAAEGAVTDADTAMAYLKQLVTAQLAGPTDTGVAQIHTTTEDLNQAADTYDLFAGDTHDVILESLSIKMPTGAAGGALTSIAIQTDDVTPSVLINATDGAVGNLGSEAELVWTGSVYITVGTKIQLTIAGGAHGSTYTTKVTAKIRATATGGKLT